MDKWLLEYIIKDISKSDKKLIRKLKLNKIFNNKIIWKK